MKLGANSVLFGGFHLETAFASVAMAGYDGIELSAIDSMSEHLELDCWQRIAPEISQLRPAGRGSEGDAIAVGADGNYAHLRRAAPAKCGQHGHVILSDEGADIVRKHFCSSLIKALLLL